jgi:carbonic anhydrase
MAASPDLALAVVGCMDARYSIQRVLDLSHGHAKVVRTAGPALDDGVRRSLAVAVHFLGVRHITVLGHTDCGMGVIGRGEADVPQELSAALGRDAEGARAWLGGFRDTSENVRAICRAIEEDAVISDHVDVFGLIYDNATGHVRPVE